LKLRRRSSRAESDAPGTSAQAGEPERIAEEPSWMSLPQATSVAGCSRCEALVPSSGEPQCVDGRRLVVAGWP
jgi:hypothetical protein